MGGFMRMTWGILSVGPSSKWLQKDRRWGENDWLRSENWLVLVLQKLCILLNIHPCTCEYSNIRHTCLFQPFNVNVRGNYVWTFISPKINLTVLPAESCLGGDLHWCRCSSPGRCWVRPWTPQGRWFQDLLGCVWRAEAERKRYRWIVYSINIHSMFHNIHMIILGHIQGNKMMENTNEHQTFHLNFMWSY